MGLLVGVCGFAGVGKSTAIDHLHSRCAGETIYLGSAVLDEVRKRGLPETRDSERHVRLDLRKHDPAALARLKSASVAEALKRDVPVLVDAIMVIEEYEVLASLVNGTSTHLLSIEAPLFERCQRLSQRAKRPFTAEEVLSRDALEIESLSIHRVFTASTYRIVNDRSLTDFQRELNVFLDTSCDR